MSVAWTTVLVVLFLLPGVMFIAGYLSRARFKRQVVQANVVGEVAFALTFSIALHAAALGALWLLRHVEVDAILRPLLLQPAPPTAASLREATLSLQVVATYSLVQAIVGFVAGVGVAATGVFGRLGPHPWTGDLFDDGKGIVLAHVMTTTVTDSKVLMYSGRLREFFLNADGQIAYVVLSDCIKFSLSLSDERLRSGGQTELFKAAPHAGAERLWNYLSISGPQILNIAFEKMPLIEAAEGDEKAVELLGGAPAGEAVAADRPTAGPSAGL